VKVDLREIVAAQLFSPDDLRGMAVTEPITPISIEAALASPERVARDRPPRVPILASDVDCRGCPTTRAHRRRWGAFAWTTTLD
jgi:hypothetical protein